jgi:protein SCO1/2
MKRPLLIALAVSVLGSTVAIAMLRARVQPLPRLGEVPAFSLVNLDDKPFGSRDLDGRPWVVDFVFTSCPSICPRMTEDMARLQQWIGGHGLDGRVRLVSISVDPKTDTPAVLRGYAERFHARPASWAFLTGDPATIENAIVNGFKIAVGREKDDSEDGFSIVHGTKFVLVDGKRQIRGYYDSNDATAQAALRRDLSTLADGND